MSISKNKTFKHYLVSWLCMCHLVKLVIHIFMTNNGPGRSGTRWHSDQVF